MRSFTHYFPMAWCDKFFFPFFKSNHVHKQTMKTTIFHSFLTLLLTIFLMQVAKSEKGADLNFPPKILLRITQKSSSSCTANIIAVKSTGFTCVPFSPVVPLSFWQSITTGSETLHFNCRQISVSTSTIFPLLFDYFAMT